MRLTVIVLIVLMLCSTLLHASSEGRGDPDKGGSTSLEETETYIVGMLKDSVWFDGAAYLESVHIAFNGTQVTVIEESFHRETSTQHGKTAYSFNLKDLNPTEVSYGKKLIELSATEYRHCIQAKEYEYTGLGAIYGAPSIRMTAILWITVNPTIVDFEQRLANAFAHAIKLSGGQTELHNDPFK